MTWELPGKVQLWTLRFKVEETCSDSMVQGLLYIVLATRSCSNTLALIAFSCRMLEKWRVVVYANLYFQICFRYLGGSSQALALR